MKPYYLLILINVLNVIYKCIVILIAIHSNSYPSTSQNLIYEHLMKHEIFLKIR